MSERSVINHEPFGRLRCKVFGNINDILVEERQEDNVIELSPFDNHPITKEPATRTGLTSLEIAIEVLGIRGSNDESEEEDRFHAPAPLKVERDDGDKITVGDIVISLHKYLNTHKIDIVETSDESVCDEAVVEVVDADGNAYPKFDEIHPLLFYSLARDYVKPEGQQAAFVVLIWEGELGMTLEDIWKTRRSDAYLV